MDLIPGSGQISLFSEEEEEALSQFLVLISLPDELSSDIVKMKQQFREEYGSYPSLHSAPHISVCSFLLMQQRSEKVFSVLQKYMTPLSPFSLYLDGFDAFSSRVIYCKVKKSSAFNTINREFDQARKQLMIRKNYSASTIPHVTIARGLQPAVFNSAKEQWLKRSYRGSFKVNKLTVLNYDFQDKKYRKYTELYLGKS